MTQDPKAEALNRLRARRDEVEQLLRENGWLVETSGNLRRWTWGASVAYTPYGEPSLDDRPRWDVHLAHAAAIADKPIDTVADSPKPPAQEPKPQEAAGEREHDYCEPGCGHAPESGEIPTPKVEPHPGRWGQQHSALMPDGLAGVAARGQEPTPPGPTVAELQAQLQRERERADCERQRANEAIAQLHDAQERIEALKASNTDIAQELADVDWTLNLLGASGSGPAKYRLLQVLSDTDRRAILEVEAAELGASLARMDARRLNPPPAEKRNELAARYFAVQARILVMDNNRGEE